MTSALQTILPMRAERVCSLLSVYDVRSRIGLNEDEALALARIEWGFDISSGEAKRMELRLLPSTVEHFEQLGRPRQQPPTWEDVKKELVRGAATGWPRNGAVVYFIEGTTAQLILNCSSTHLNSFIGTQLREVPGTKHTSGPNGTPKITVDSFLEFLRKRKVR